MTKKKLVKKTQVTAKQEGLNRADLLLDAKKKNKAQDDYPLISPGLDPSLADTKTLVGVIETDILAQGSLQAQLLAKTEKINTGCDLLKDTYVKWSHQIEKIPGITVENIKQLVFGVKGVYDGHAESPITVLNSHALIINAINAGSLTITLEVVNNVSLTSQLPVGALYVDLYQTFVEANCTDPKKMSYLGRVPNGKFTTHYSADDLNKKVYFIAVYVIKSGVDGESELSPKMQATVV